jgi:hypothetical protein
MNITDITVYDVASILTALQEAEDLEESNGRTMTAHMLYGLRRRIELQLDRDFAEAFPNWFDPHTPD